MLLRSRLKTQKLRHIYFCLKKTHWVFFAASGNRYAAWWAMPCFGNKLHRIPFLLFQNKWSWSAQMFFSSLQIISSLFSILHRPTAPQTREWCTASVYLSLTQAVQTIMVVSRLNSCILVSQWGLCWLKIQVFRIQERSLLASRTRLMLFCTCYRVGPAML